MGFAKKKKHLEFKGTASKLQLEGQDTICFLNWLVLQIARWPYLPHSLHVFENLMDEWPMQCFHYFEQTFMQSLIQIPAQVMANIKTEG